MTEQEREMLETALSQSVATNHILMAILFALAANGTLSALDAELLFESTLSSMENFAGPAAGRSLRGEKAWTTARALVEKQLGMVIQIARTGKPS